MEESKSRYKQKNSSVVNFAESYFAEIFEADSSAPFKDVYQQYREFCSDEGIKRAFSKKDFRSALVSEGYRIENSTKHANQLRIIAT
jgi:phage/plasmid-associated DNA primase